MIYPNLDEVFEFVQVIPDFANGHIVSWGIKRTCPFSLADTFKVQVSEEITFDEVLREYTSDSLSAVIPTCDILNDGWSCVPFIRVVQTTLDDVEQASHPVEFSLTTVAGRKAAYAADANRQTLSRLRRDGRPGWLIQRRWQSATVQENVDPVTGDPLTRISPDFGSYASQGYHDQQPFFFDVAARQEGQRPSPDGNGRTEQFTFSASSAGFPRLGNDDIIVDTLTGRRYMLEDVTAKLFPATNIPIVHTFGGRLLPASDPLYQLPIPSNY